MKLPSAGGPRIRRGRMLILLLVGLWPMTSAPAAGQPAQAVPQLVVGSPFVPPGGTVTFTVTGTPGAFVKILQTKQPAEIDLGAAGIAFYAPGSEASVASGTISASGLFVATLPMPASAQTGVTLYAQAVSQLAGRSVLGNGIVYRVQRAPSGPRKTSAIAVTPDGTRAYVADNLDGVVTVLDAVADTLLAQLPISVDAGDVPHRPVRVAVDPEGRHAFVTNAAASHIAVIHAATGSISAQIPVPRGCRGIGFDFSGGVRRIYVANETLNSVLVFEEAPVGTFTAAGSIPLQSTAPGPLLVLPDGKLAVGTRTDEMIEILDPQAAAGATTIALTFIGGSPFDLAWDGSEILIPTFVTLGEDRIPGFNRVLRMDAVRYQVAGYLFEDLGTDYRSIAVRPTTAGSEPLIAVNASGTGTTLIADGASLAVLDDIELTGGYPDATPQDLAIVDDPASGLPSKIYVVDYFRETVRPILLAGGPPYARGPEIALAWSGQVRVPLGGALSYADSGEWQFRDVVALGGTAATPNPVTCNSCHMDGASDNSRVHSVQVPAPWGSFATAPYFWDGSVPTIQNLVHGALRLHNHSGIAPPGGTELSLLEFLSSHQPPASIYLNQDGTMSADQQAGKALFEGVAHCTQCHAAPTFIPPPGSPRTIVDGIGTGLAPVDVPSLRGAWATAPYLHDGSATTLLDVLTINPADAHWQAAAPLTDDQRRQLVEYVKTL